MDIIDHNKIDSSANNINFTAIAIYFSLIILLFSGNISSQVQLLGIGAAAKYFIILFVSLLAFEMLFVSGERIELKPLLLLLTLKTVYTIVKWAFSDNYNTGYVDITEMFCIESLILLLFTSSHRLSEQFLIRVCRLTLLIASLETIIAFMIAYSMAGDFFGIKPMITIPWGGSNYISSILLLVLSVYVALPDNKYMKTILIFLGCCAVILTRSTSGVVGLTVLFVLSGAKSGKFDLKAKLMLLLLLGAIIFIVYSMIPGFFGRIANSYISIRDKDYSVALNGRDQLYSICKTLIHDRPITGYGPQYRYLLPDNTYAHNFILDELCRGGIIGLLLSIICIICAVQPLVSSSIDIAFGMKCALIISCIISLFEPTYNTLVFDYYYYLFLIPSYLWTVNEN